MSPQLSSSSIETRRTRIGASEVGALLGMHPYTTPARIYARIVDGDTIPQSASMGVGKSLEAPVLRMAADVLGLRVRACSHTYVHPDLPLAATPDAWAIDDAGRLGLVEIKISGDYSLWTDLPAAVEWQVRAQLALSGRSWAYVAALVGSSLRTYRVDRDDELEAIMLDAVDRFDRLHLTPRVPPATDDADLVLRWSLRAGEVLADGWLAVLGETYADVVRERRKLEAAEKAARETFALEVARRSASLVIGKRWRATVDDAGRMRFEARGA
jgi:predicted phage-related endonuclease